jgi:AcrR family transcriptional regulator
MPRPRSLASTDIANAALQVIDRDGLASLSMRTTAAELGVGTMSLYRYIQDREALERLVVDQVLTEVDTELPPDTPWQQQITCLAERIRHVVSVHPSIVPLLMLHRHTSVGVKCFAEVFLRGLKEGGFIGAQRVIALRTLLSYLAGALQAQHFGALDGPATRAIANMQPAKYPLLVDTAQVALRISPDEEFRSGIAIILLGLATLRSTAPTER